MLQEIVGVCWSLVIERLKVSGRGEMAVWGFLSQIYFTWNFEVSLGN